MDERISVMVLGGSPDIRRRLGSDLARLGFETFTGRYPDMDTDYIIRESPDIVLLELTAGDRDSLSAGELLLREGVLPPGTALVALVPEKDMGQIPLDYKFADVIGFPYDVVELEFRLRRVEHRYRQEHADDTIRIGNLSISPSRYEVRVDGEPVVLSHKEYELLKYLITHPNHVITREVLLTSLWGDNLVSESRTVDVHIRRVRAKIGDIDGIFIRTVRGVGYTIRSENA